MSDPRTPLEVFKMSRPRDLRELAKELFEEASKLNAARDEVRRLAEDISGCNVSEWPFEDCLAYVELAREWALKHKISPKN